MLNVVELRDRELLALIAGLGRAGRGLQAGEVFCAGVTFTQFFILDLVDRAGRLALSELHETLTVDKSTTTRLVAPLLQRDLLRSDRRPDDSRARELVLTASGSEVLGSVWGCVGRVMGEVRSAIPEAEREVVLDSVARFLRVLNDVCRPGCC